MLLVILCLFLSFAFAEKLYVVERERSAIAVVEDGVLKGRVEDLGNMNHATVKVKDRYAYVISRDGWLSKIDIREDKLLKKVKVGDSSIGFDFAGGSVVVANYAPESVVILDQDLNVKKVLDTSSRNVGIKGFENLLVFSLMDRDEVWVVNAEGEKVKVFEKVGAMPFDALLSKDKYVVGFFKEQGVGILDLGSMSYRKRAFSLGGREVVFKIPHFGLWGVKGNTAYIPAVGERRVYVVDLQSFELKGHLELEGLPVFVVVSPDGRFVAVNYSGDKEDFISLIDTKEGKLIKSASVGKRVMHLRFSKDSKLLYISSYFESKVKALSVPDLKTLWEVAIPNPSGVFLVQ